MTWIQKQETFWHIFETQADESKYSNITKDVEERQAIRVKKLFQTTEWIIYHRDSYKCEKVNIL